MCHVMRVLVVVVTFLVAAVPAWAAVRLAGDEAARTVAPIDVRADPRPRTTPTADGFRTAPSRARPATDCDDDGEVEFDDDDDCREGERQDEDEGDGEREPDRDDADPREEAGDE
jgi:hypothetical protein